MRIWHVATRINRTDMIRDTTVANNLATPGGERELVLYGVEAIAAVHRAIAMQIECPGNRYRYFLKIAKHQLSTQSHTGHP
jgi:hypothetical protein